MQALLGEVLTDEQLHVCTTSLRTICRAVLAIALATPRVIGDTFLTTRRTPRILGVFCASSGACRLAVIAFGASFRAQNSWRPFAPPMRRPFCWVYIGYSMLVALFVPGCGPTWLTSCSLLARPLWPRPPRPHIVATARRCPPKQHLVRRARR